MHLHSSLRQIPQLHCKGKIHIMVLVKYVFQNNNRSNAATSTSNKFVTSSLSLYLGSMIPSIRIFLCGLVRSMVARPLRSTLTVPFTVRFSGRPIMVGTIRLLSKNILLFVYEISFPLASSWYISKKLKLDPDALGADCPSWL